MTFVTSHPLTAADSGVTAALRAAAVPNKGMLRGVAARPIFDKIIGQTPDAPGVTYRADTVGGIPGWWCTPPTPRPGSVVLHIHGGWFHWGTALAFRALVGQIALRAGTQAFVPDYRLAPEHPFPAGLDDAKACFDGLRDLGFERVALSGDSAGGNLVLLLSGLVEAVATVALSPVTDLSLSGDSWISRAEADFYFTRSQGEEMARGYLGGRDPLDPRISPLFGDLSGRPPVRVHVGDQEMLFDDSRRYVDRAVAAGVDAKLDIWEGMPHGFAGAVGQLEAAREALDSIGRFLAGHLAPV